MTSPVKLTSSPPRSPVDTVEPTRRRFPPGWWLIPAALAGLMLWGLIALALIDAAGNTWRN